MDKFESVLFAVATLTMTILSFVAIVIMFHIAMLSYWSLIPIGILFVLADICFFKMAFGKD